MSDEKADQLIDKTLEDSFPASDAPSWGGGSRAPDPGQEAGAGAAASADEVVEESPPGGRKRGASSPSLASGLAWFSLCLGAAEALMPRRIARASGVDGSHRLVVACGLRELAAGAGLMLARRKTFWLWGRVAGDALDAAALASAAVRARRGRALLALAAIAGVTALDVFAACQAVQADKRGATTS